MKPIYFIILFAMLGCTNENTRPIKKDKTMDNKNMNLHHFNFRSAIMSGYYERDFTLEQVLEKGDFGIGTFNNLDGEMILLNGTFYRATTDGTVEELVDLSEKIPSATVAFFNPDEKVEFENTTKAESVDWINTNLNTEKGMFAFKLTGTFKTLKTLKAHSQESITERPFPLIEDIVDNMVYHDLDHVNGSLVGFQLPPYVLGINYPGLHFHFVGKAFETNIPGGCAPQYEIAKGTLEIMRLTSFSVDVPKDEEFNNMKIIPEKPIEM